MLPGWKRPQKGLDRAPRRPPRCGKPRPAVPPISATSSTQRIRAPSRSPKSSLPWRRCSPRPEGQTMAASDFSRLIAAAADTIAAHAEELTALDQAIGDGDHGLNMKRGFEAVRAEADAFAAKPLPEALKAVGTKLVMTVGGASGPLFGTLFMALGKDL